VQAAKVDEEALAERQVYPHAQDPGATGPTLYERLFTLSQLSSLLERRILINDLSAVC
jgi:hypothetical protein